jgi:glutathione synthase/RimK-type ligase-like ATP-grasp enzyme
MATQIIVVEESADAALIGEGHTVVHVDDYLTRQEFFKQRNIQVINLCRSYRYLSVGYYCSLLAEARRHRVVPSVKSILDLSSKAMYSLDAENLDQWVQRSFRKYRRAEDDGAFEMLVLFGTCGYEALADLARQIFETFPFPVLRVKFNRQGRWQIGAIEAVSIHRLDAAGREAFAAALDLYRKKRWRSARAKTPPRYDIAILHNPADPLPPSDARALKKFVKAGQQLGVAVDLIEKKDYARLAEYDALFIRDTTRIRHYTYRFAKKAESESMVVIDDPQSILRCTNKVYLAELLRSHRVPTPKTVIVGKADIEAAERAIGYPMVLKVPEGAFSSGVFKVEDGAGLRDTAARIFKESELILAQEFLYTEFDWRIGVLNRRPIYASQYFMSKKHWQIVHYDAKGGFTEGAFTTVPVEEAPDKVVAVALKAANLIGDGLYGVDVKATPHGVFVIEVNDNPNIDSGVEDLVLKDELYRMVMAEFIRRLDGRRGRAEPL